MKTIITAEFKHETNRYSPGKTDMTAFQNRSASWGERRIRDFYRGAKNEMTGFLDYFDREGDFRPVPVLALNAQPGPVVSSDVWETVKGALLDAICAEARVDGILLALHGAMVTDSTEDGEGDLLEALRSQVGPHVPIICTLDLHANVTEKMVRNADGFFPYDYYPHTDLYEAGQRAADCMYRAVLGQIHPVIGFAKLDCIIPYIPTAHPEMAPFVEKTQQLRRQGAVLTANLCHGFFAADIYDLGAAVLVTADGDLQKAKTLADRLGKEIFEKRYNLKRSFYTPEQALKLAMKEKNTPVTIADVADNPGSGGTGDSTWLLKAMIEMDVQDAALAVIYDPETVMLAERAGVGSEVEVSVGGKLVPELTGGPVRALARVCAINDGMVYNREGCSKGVLTPFGKCAVLKIGGIYVIVSSIRTQPWGLEIYRYCGITPSAMKLLVVKSAVQFRASFETVSPVILDVEAPALGPQSPKMLPLAHCRRPIYPLDD